MSSEPQSKEASLSALSADPQFVAMCTAVQALRYRAADRAAFDSVAPFELTGLDLSARVTAGETPFEARLRAAVAARGGDESALYVATVKAHDSDASVEQLIALYAPVALTASGDLTDDGAVITPASAEESLYLALSLFKYCVFGETNHVTRALFQRTLTYLFMHTAAAVLRFTKAGAEVQAPEGSAPSADATPLADLLDACRSGAADRNNAVLNSVRKIDAAGLAGESSKLSAVVRQQQMSLNRAIGSIATARAQFGDETKQLAGFVALLSVCVTVFYGWMLYRPVLWARMRVPLAVCALTTAAVVLAVTGVAIVRPVERFEQDYAEGFCNAAGECEAAMEAWASDAARQAYVSTLDATAALTKRELDTRNDVLSADLAAISQRVNATDIEYRDALFSFNRVRQAKRFVVMTLAVALFLMVIVLMGAPRSVTVGLHVAAAVVILLVATLVYRGNAQRSRGNWNIVYHPGPDDI